MSVWLLRFLVRVDKIHQSGFWLSMTLWSNILLLHIMMWCVIDVYWGFWESGQWLLVVFCFHSFIKLFLLWFPAEDYAFSYYILSRSSALRLLLTNAHTIYFLLNNVYYWTEFMMRRFLHKMRDDIVWNEQQEVGDTSSVLVHCYLKHRIAVVRVMYVL